MMTGQPDEVPVEFQDSTQRPAQEASEAAHPDAAPHAGWAGGEDPAQRPGAGERPVQPDSGDNLVDLPEGAAFGRTEEPSAAEREELGRQAAGVQREMREESQEED